MIVYQVLFTRDDDIGSCGCSLIGVDEVSVCVRICNDNAGHSAGRVYIAGNGRCLSNGVGSVFGQADNGDRFVILQRNDDLAVLINGNVASVKEGSVGLVNGVGLACKRFGKGNLKCELLIQHCIGGRCKIVCDILDNGKITVLVRSVRYGSGCKLIGSVENLAQRGNRNGIGLASNVVFSVNGNVFANGTCRAARDSAYVYGLACLYVHGENVINVSGDRARYVVSVCISDNGSCGYGGGNGNGQGVSVVCTSECLGKRLCKCDTGVDGCGELTVVAKPYNHVVAVVNGCSVVSVYRCVSVVCGLGVVSGLNYGHIVESAGADRANAKHCVDIGISVIVHVCCDNRSNLIKGDSIANVAGHVSVGFAVVNVGFSVMIIERNGFLKISPIGVSDIGDLFSSRGSVSRGDCGAIISNVGVYTVGVGKTRILVVCQPGEIIFARFVENTVFISFPVNIRTVHSGYGCENVLIRLVIIISVKRRRLESHVGITHINEPVIVRVGGVHFAEGIAVERDLAGGIIDVFVTAVDLGNVDLTVREKNVGP